MPTALVGARVLTPDEEIAPGTVLIDDSGVIMAVGRDVTPLAGAQISRLPNLALAPGFIDLHVHGGGGFSLATSDLEEIRSYARWVVAKGVTSFLASVCASWPEEGLACLRTVAAVSGPIENGATLLGAHLEGPFVSPRRRGALPKGWLHEPDIELFERLDKAAAGQLRVLTLAPELPGADVLLATVLARGIVAAVGHTDATYDEALAAFRTGASHLTHAFNAMRPFHHRDPGPLAAAVASPSVTAELIGDGVHVHPAAARLLLSSLGPHRVVLVSDGVPPAGLSEGTFPVAGRKASLKGGRITLADGTIAGSAATMDQVVRNVLDWGLADAVAMASRAPARVLGLGAHKGRIAPGYDADLVALDEDLAVVMTWVGGRLVYFGQRAGRS